MFVKCTDTKAVRLTGRWSVLNTTWDFKDNETAVTTAPGAIIELAFSGDFAILHFDTVFNVQPYPHLWISVDGGAMVETPLYDYIRVNAADKGEHNIKIIFKSSTEEYSRWHRRLVNKVGFRGFEAEAAGTLTPDNRKVIEFLGDSITEGVLADEEYRVVFRGSIDEYNNARNKYMNRQLDQENRVSQDDSAATYAFLTAENLNLRPRIMAYGGIGVTCGANGGVPNAREAYMYYFHGQPIDYPPADYILLNYGTNDRREKEKENVVKAYIEMLDIVIKYNPKAKIIVLSPFCNVFADEFGNMVKEYNEKNNKDILFINGSGIIPVEPIHPTREGHKIVANYLTKILKEYIGE